MEDFTSNIRVAPQDKIAPAIGNFTNDLLQVAAMKKAEDDRKMQKLTDLATISYGDVSLKDNTDLQKAKGDFMQNITSAYGDAAKAGHSGNLSWEVQADLAAKKQQIMMTAAKAESDKKEYLDVTKHIATNKDIDQEESLKKLQEIMNQPISQRGSFYDAIKMKYDLDEHIDKALKDIKTIDRTEPKGNEYWDYKRADIEAKKKKAVALYESDPDARRVTDKLMKEAGVSNKSSVDVGNFYESTGRLGSTEPDYHIRQKHEFVGTPGAASPPANPTNTPETTMNIKSNTGTMLPVNVYHSEPLTDKETSFSGKTYYDFSNYEGGFKSSAEDIKMHSSALKTLPATWFPGTKDRQAGWYPLEKGDEANATNVERKNFIVGNATVKEQQYDKDGDKVGKPTPVEKEIAVPADAENMRQVNASLNPKSIKDKKYNTFGDGFVTPFDDPNKQQSAQQTKKADGLKPETAIPMENKAQYQDGKPHYFTKGGKTAQYKWNVKSKQWEYIGQ